MVFAFRIFPWGAGVTGCQVAGKATKQAGIFNRLAGQGAQRVNCFTPGALIDTPSGACPVEDLRPGDTVHTRDNGPQPVRWIGSRTLEGPVLRVANHLHPVVIRKNALGAGLPSRDLRLSPGHRLLLLGDHPLLDAGEAEVFVFAGHLAGTRGIFREAVTRVRYIHFLCDRHEVVRSHGIWTESFQPNAPALEGMSQSAREELLTLFPELGAAASGEGFAAARPTRRAVMPG